MKIAFDIDGVLRDFIAGIDVVYKEVYPDHKLLPLTGYDLKERYPLGKEIGRFVFQKHTDRIYSDAPVIAGALGAFTKLQEKYTVGVITS